MDKRKISWGEVENLVCKIVNDIKSTRNRYYDRVVCTKKSSIFGGLLASEFGIELEVVDISKMRECTIYENIILVDNTTQYSFKMEDAERIVPWQTCKAVLVHNKDSLGSYEPDFVGRVYGRNEHIIFPWESVDK